MASQTVNMDRQHLVHSHSGLIFVLVGGANTLISQGLLVLLLAWLPVGSATLISQLLHAGSGYCSSRWAVFQRRGSPLHYALVVLASWGLQWQALKALLATGLSRPAAVALLVPPLALWSYVLQRKLVFR
jgi:putative flippase GtrA